VLFGADDKMVDANFLQTQMSKFLNSLPASSRIRLGRPLGTNQLAKVARMAESASTYLMNAVEAKYVVL
jgi:hypothetical protein